MSADTVMISKEVVSIKRFLSYFLCVLFILCFSVNAFAEVTKEVDKNGNEVYTSDILSAEQNKALAETQEIISKAYTDLGDSIINDLGSGEVSSSVYTVSITPNSTNGLKAVLLSLMGDYEPIVTDYTYRQGSSSYESHSIDVQPDFVWICSFVIFSLIIYCLFRLGGAMFG